MMTQQGIPANVAPLTLDSAILTTQKLEFVNLGDVVVGEENMTH